MKLSLTVRILLIISWVTPQILAQTPSTGLGRFAKDGLSFDYPAEWMLTDRSNPQAQHLILGHKDSSVLIMVIAHRDFISTNDELAGARDNITIPFVEDLALKMGATEKPLWRSAQCTQVGQITGVGFVLHGQIRNQPSTGEVYTLVLGGRFVNLVYIRMNKDEIDGDATWRTVRDSLRIEPNPANQKNSVENFVSAGVLNGTAIELPRPSYPYDALRSGTSGIVIVQVTIDETGKVVAARPTKGPSQLTLVSVAAARRARFSPTTLCGRPIKVIGIIEYNFPGM
jgi:hypothetical protein